MKFVFALCTCIQRLLLAAFFYVNLSDACSISLLRNLNGVVKIGSAQFKVVLKTVGKSTHRSCGRSAHLGLLLRTQAIDTDKLGGSEANYKLLMQPPMKAEDLKTDHVNPHARTPL